MKKYCSCCGDDEVYFEVKTISKRKKISLCKQCWKEILRKKIIGECDELK